MLRKEGWGDCGHGREEAFSADRGSGKLIEKKTKTSKKNTAEPRRNGVPPLAGFWSANGQGGGGDGKKKGRSRSGGCLLDEKTGLNQSGTCPTRGAACTGLNRSQEGVAIPRMRIGGKTKIDITISVVGGGGGINLMGTAKHALRGPAWPGKGLGAQKAQRRKKNDVAASSEEKKHRLHIFQLTRRTAPQKKGKVDCRPSFNGYLGDRGRDRDRLRRDRVKQKHGRRKREESQPGNRNADLVHQDSLQ